MQKKICVIFYRMYKSCQNVEHRSCFGPIGYVNICSQIAVVFQ